MQIYSTFNDLKKKKKQLILLILILVLFVNFYSGFIPKLYSIIPNESKKKSEIASLPHKNYHE